MDPAPRAFADLPRDPALGVPVPFACGTGGPYDGTSGSPPTARSLDGRRVTQCALSRVCGVCGSGLGRPIAFVGSPAEEARNAFHFPPTHLDCAEALRRAYERAGLPVPGREDAGDGWVVVTTAGFEFVRAGREDADPRPTFQPNSVLGRV